MRKYNVAVIPFSGASCSCFSLHMLSQQDKQLKSETGKQTEAAILTEHKKKEREAAKQGKRPFYLKKCMSSDFLMVCVHMHFFRPLMIGISVSGYGEGMILLLMLTIKLI